MAQAPRPLRRGRAEEGLRAPTSPNKLFDLMAMFAEYGFNKSHTAAYAVVTYQTAWLKAHYPAEFMAATLSSDMDDTDKVQLFVTDAKANKVEVLRPTSTRRRCASSRSRDRAIRYGLGAVKGSGASAVACVVQTRTAGALPRPLRLLRAHRPKGGEPAGRRGAGACRRLRLHRPRPREAAGQRRHGDRRGRGARGRHQPGEPVRRRRRRRWCADRMAARRALDRASAAPGGEERARVLPERTPVPRLRGRGAALRSHARWRICSLRSSRSGSRESSRRSARR